MWAANLFSRLPRPASACLSNLSRHAGGHQCLTSFRLPALSTSFLPCASGTAPRRSLHKLPSQEAGEKAVRQVPTGDAPVINSHVHHHTFPQIYSTTDTMQKLLDLGRYKGTRDVSTLLVSAAAAGAFLSIGCSVYLVLQAGLLDALGIAAGSGMPGSLLAGVLSACVFPIGLSFIMFTETELLTGNMMYTLLPAYQEPSEGAHWLRKAAHVMAISFVGNFAACGAMALLLSGLLFTTPTLKAVAVAVAMKKCSLSVGAVFGKAVLANWLVCLAMFNASRATSITGKMVGIWLPISSFVVLGFEHSVANGFLLPLGVLSGAPIGWLDIWTVNIVPALAGNLVGGGVLLGFSGWYAHRKHLQ